MTRLYLIVFILYIFLLAFIDSRFLRFRELNKYGKHRRISLGMEIQLRAMLATTILAFLAISPIFAFFLPRISLISNTINFGEIYASGFAFYHLGYILQTIATSNHNNKKQVWRIWTDIFERIFLFGLNKELRTQYNRHGAWRWEVMERTAVRWLNSPKPNSISLKRVVALFIAAFLSMLSLELLVGQIPPFGHGEPLISMKRIIDSPQILTGILLILGSPIAFTVWLFRDQNNLWQLENNRKDINLKDFQKLAEWAAGLHLPEDKISQTIKTSSSVKSDANSQERESAELNETTDTVESVIQPKSGMIKTYSRRDGAVALQIAAIYQMQAFLRGDFGVHFQRPAFQLLKSVWMALTQNHVADIDNIKGKNRKEFADKITTWREKMFAITSEGVGGALALTMSEGNGRVLRNHANDLPRITLAGWRGLMPGHNFKLNNIVFDGLNFQGASLQGIDWSQAYLSRIELSSAKLYGANLSYTHLQRSDLRWADARFANFNGARMQGALLDAAFLIGADMMVADLRGASLDGARLHSAFLDGAQLEGARLLNIMVDAHTSFAGATIDITTIIAVAALKPGFYNSADQKYPEDFIVNEAQTALLRASLVQNGLIFPKSI